MSAPNSNRPRTAEVQSSDASFGSAALQCLACPFRAVFHFIFTDSFVPTDTFIPKMRKVVSGGLMLSSLTLIPNYLDFITTLTNPAATADQLMYAYLEFFLYDLFPTIATVAPFIYCRATKSAPDWVTSIPGFVLTASQIFYALSTTTIDLTPPAMALYCVFGVTMVGRVWTILALISCVLLVLINGLIISRTIEWTIPGARSPYAPESFVNFLATQGFCFIILTLFLYIVISQFDGMINKAQSAATLSKDLASKLQRYDTDGARDVLKRCVSSRHSQTSGASSGDLVVDEELLDAFTGIIENLERYRPHLPNYLLDENVADAESRAVSGRKGSTQPGTTRSSNMYEVTSAADEPEQRSARLQVSDVTDDAPLALGASTMIHNGGDTTMKREALGSVMTKVTATLVDFRWSPGHMVTDRKPLFDAIVSMANDVALLTQASLHSAIGDQLIATWNATRRIPKPEARGCLFAVRFRDHLAKSAVVPKGAVTVASMTATGPSESCFAGDHRLRLFTCTSPVLWGVLRAGLDRTSHLRTDATDLATRDHAAVDVATRGLTVLKPSAAVPAAVWMYELLGERAKDEKDEEWMYTLEQHADDESARVTQAFHAYAAGRVTEGLQMLRPIVEDGEAHADESVLALLREMEQAGTTAS